MDRMLRSEDIGVAGRINKFRGRLKIHGGVAVFQIEYIEVGARSRINFIAVLRSMRRVATRHGASQIRIEAAIANVKLHEMLSRKLGESTMGQDRQFLDTWTIDVAPQ